MKLGALQSMASQRVRHNLVTEQQQRRGRSSWESRINTCPRPRVKHTAVGSCYSPRGSARCPPMTWGVGGVGVEGRLKREETCTVSADSPCCTTEANTTLQSNQTPFKNFFKIQLHCFEMRKFDQIHDQKPRNVKNL